MCFRIRNLEFDLWPDSCSLHMGFSFCFSSFLDLHSLPPWLLQKDSLGTFLPNLVCIILYTFSTKGYSKFQTSESTMCTCFCRCQHLVEPKVNIYLQWGKKSQQIIYFKHAKDRCIQRCYRKIPQNPEKKSILLLY